MEKKGFLKSKTLKNIQNQDCILLDSIMERETTIQNLKNKILTIDTNHSDKVNLLNKIISDVTKKLEEYELTEFADKLEGHGKQNSCESEIEFLKKQIVNKDAEIQNIIHNYTQILKTNDDKYILTINELQENLKNCKELLYKKDYGNLQLKSKHVLDSENLLGNISVLENEIKFMKNYNESQEMKFKTIIKDQNLKIENLGIESNQIHEELNTLLQKHKKLQSDYNELKISLTRSDKKIRRLEIAFEELKFENEQKSKEIQTFQCENESLKQEMKNILIHFKEKMNNDASEEQVNKMFSTNESSEEVLSPLIERKRAFTLCECLSETDEPEDDFHLKPLNSIEFKNVVKSYSMNQDDSVTKLTEQISHLRKELEEKEFEFERLKSDMSNVVLGWEREVSILKIKLKKMSEFYSKK